jgi:nucleoside-diphosphate-sugar epimerase
VGGTLNLLIASRDAGVKRLVFASSSSVYGDSPEVRKHEGMIPAPLSPYAVGKLAGEHYCVIFTRLYGLDCTALRYFNVFGPRQDPRSQYAAVIPKFFMGLRGEAALVIDGDGEQTRDFTFVGNVAEANALALESPSAAGAVMNIACGESTSINTLLRIMQGVLGVSATARHGSPRPGDVRHSLADITRARKMIGFKPSVDLKEGLRITAGCYEKNCGR